MGRGASGRRRQVLVSGAAAQTAPPELRLLSVRQPWASLIAWGEKTDEIRSWNTDYRGLLAVHASLTKGTAEKEVCLRAPIARLLEHHGHTFETLPFGKIIAVVRVVDSVPINAAPDGPGFRRYRRRSGRALLDTAVAKAAPDRRTRESELWTLLNCYAIGVTEPRLLSQPIPIRGQIGLRRVDDQTRSAILAQLRS